MSRFHHFARGVSEAISLALEFIGEAFVVDAELVQDGGLRVVDVTGVFAGVLGKFIRRAVGDPVDWLGA